MPLDTSVPPWLQRNLAPEQNKGPWLAEQFSKGMEIGMQMQRLPLQIQGMQLANKANALAVEHQGMLNDLQNQEMNNYAEDLPALRSYMESVAKTPGGSLAMTPPAFKSQRALAAVLQRQKMDADTAYGKAFMENQIELTKTAAVLRQKGYDVEQAQEVGPNGELTWNGSKLSELGNQAAEDAAIRAIELRKSGNEWRYDPITGQLLTGPARSSAGAVDDKLLTDLRAQYDAAAVKGDQLGMTRIQERIDFLKGKHRDPQEAARSTLLRQQILQKEKQLGDLTLKSKWPQLEQELKQLQTEFENLGTAPTSGGNLPTSAAPLGKVRVRNPEGKTGYIPADQLDSALKQGFEQIQ